MLARLDRSWRFVATGLAFVLFGIGGVLLQALVPLLHAVLWTQDRRTHAVRRTVHWAFWIYVRLLRILGVLAFRMTGTQRLSRAGMVIVANHPTLLDVVFLLSVVPNATCIVRAGLANNPFTRAAVRSAGYVSNDSGVEVVEMCVAALRAGSSLIIFPEGTRSDPRQPQRWQRGAANIALRAGVPLTPVRIGCEPLTLRKGEPWWQIPPRRVQYSLEVLDDLPAALPSEREGGVRAAHTLTERVRELLSHRVENNAGA